ncbi:LysR substrate-binding domain-containing protein, partial [Klebsiella quasipneumoniae]
PLVALYQTSALQQHIEEQAAGLGQALNVRIRMSHFEGLCEMVAHGAGGAILPRVIAERYLPRYRFAVITLQDRWALRRLCLCYQDDERLSPAMRRLLEWLRQP